MSWLEYELFDKEVALSPASKIMHWEPAIEKAQLFFTTSVDSFDPSRLQLTGMHKEVILR